MRALKQVWVHLFCFLLSPFLCAGPDRILIESKQFINLKSCLRVAIQLVKTFNAHLLVSYWKKNQKLLSSAKNLLDKRFFLLFVCLFVTERKPYDNHLITFVLGTFFFLIKNLRFLPSFTVLAQKMRPSNSTIISHV